MAQKKMSSGSSEATRRRPQLHGDGVNDKRRKKSKDPRRKGRTKRVRPSDNQTGERKQRFLDELDEPGREKRRIERETSTPESQYLKSEVVEMREVTPEVQDGASGPTSIQEPDPKKMRRRRPPAKNDEDRKRRPRRTGKGEKKEAQQTKQIAEAVV